MDAVLKFGELYCTPRTYNAMSSLPLKERFLFEIVPFIHTFESDVFKKVLNVIFNCFIFAPFGVLFNLVFKKVSSEICSFALVFHLRYGLILTSVIYK
jgi:glycopeptide antibiotics resistance protein